MPDFDWTPFASDQAKLEHVGDTIEGRILKIEAKDGQGGVYPMLTIQTDADGTTQELHASPRMLKSDLAHLEPQVGWWIKIELTELRHTGKPQPMKVFNIRVKQPNPAQQRVQEIAAKPVEEEVSDAPFDDEEVF